MADAEPRTPRPLVVDLERALLATDLRLERLFALLSAEPARGLRLLLAGRAGDALPDLQHLPVNRVLIDHLAGERAKGRRIVLVSALAEAPARALAASLGLPDEVISAVPGGAARAESLGRRCGPGGFDYAGRGPADLPVWQAAGGAIAVAPGQALRRALAERFPGKVVFLPGNGRPGAWLRAMRPHQWLKNLLILVPACTAHRLSAATLLACLAALVSFSLCASSVYLLNDLLDLRHDREHPTKRHRPLAAGTVDLRHAVPLLAGTLVLAAVLGALLPWRFLAILAVYYGLTLGYSLVLKRIAALDVLALACLYGLRLLAGGAATGIPLSPWLLTFAIFVFLCLAQVKRWAELGERQRRDGGAPGGRGYRAADLPALQAMATASGYVAVLVLGLYLNSPTVTALYGHPERLWGMPLIVLYWVNRVLLLTHRGEMPDDPVLFAIGDRTSLLCAALVALDMALSL